MAKNKYLTQLTKDFGCLASEIELHEKPIVTTPSPSLNWATGLGGWKPGKINVLFGLESCGKSMLAMLGIIELQRGDPEAIAIWFDSEYSFSPNFFKHLGGDLDRLVVRKSNNPTMIFDFIGNELLQYLQDGMPVKALVIDSIKSIRFPKDVKKQTTDMVMGGDGASYLGSALKLILPVIYEYQLLTFFVQQARMNIDAMKALRNPLVMPDGVALRHAADLLLEISKLDTKAGVVESGDTIAGGAAQVGHKVRIKVKKNRMAKPARVAQFTFHYDYGIIDAGAEIFELAKSTGVICHPINPETGRENTTMWQFGDLSIRGEANMRQRVIDDIELQNKIMAACYGYKDPTYQLDDTGTIIDTASDPDLTVDL